MHHMAVERDDSTEEAPPTSIPHISPRLWLSSVPGRISLKRPFWAVRIACLRERGMELILPSEYPMALAIVFSFLFTIFRC